MRRFIPLYQGGNFVGIEDTIVSHSNAPSSGHKACNQYLTQANDACCSEKNLDIDLNEDNLHDMIMTLLMMMEHAQILMIPTPTTV